MKNVFLIGFIFAIGNDSSCQPTNTVVPVCWQVYQLQTELQKAQIEKEFQKRRSLRCDPTADRQLQEEVRSLRCQLVKAEKLDPVRITTHSVFLADALCQRCPLLICKQ